MVLGSAADSLEWVPGGRHGASCLNRGIAEDSASGQCDLFLKIEWPMVFHWLVMAKRNMALTDGCQKRP